MRQFSIPQPRKNASKKREKKRATIILNLLQQKQFGEQKKYLKAKNRLPTNKKLFQISPFPDEERTIRAKGEIGKYQLDLNANHPALLL